MKYARLYSDILQALKERTLDGCEFSAEGNRSPNQTAGAGRARKREGGGGRERKKETHLRAPKSSIFLFTFLSYVSKSIFRTSMTR